jgi:hypothetical protein
LEEVQVLPQEYIPIDDADTALYGNDEEVGEFYPG